MEINLEEANCMADKILTDIKLIIDNDTNLKEFTIVPVTENKNKSPVLYEEHNLGLESWCIKHVYGYIYKELFKVRSLLNKNRLLPHMVQKINRSLIGALLINPEVNTFWNMRRELVQYAEININKELLLTKLVLSHKNKCNEAFAYRRWILAKLIKGINKERVNFALLLLQEELNTTEAVAMKAQNNYHAWNHRIWCLENILKKSPLAESEEYLRIILSQIEFSNEWIDKHVSEHSGYQYRQYLCNSILDNTMQSSSHNVYHYRQNFQHIFACYIDKDIMQHESISYLNRLLGSKDCTIGNDPKETIRCYNYYYYFLVLLLDFSFYTRKLNKMYPGHESIWYHRRFLLFHLLKAAFDYHGLPWKRRIGLNEAYTHQSDENLDANIATSRLDVIEEDVYHGRDHEKSAKIFKQELNKVKSSYLYSFIEQDDEQFISESGACLSSINQQLELSKKYGRWRRFILNFDHV